MVCSYISSIGTGIPAFLFHNSGDECNDRNPQQIGILYLPSDQVIFSCGDESDLQHECNSGKSSLTTRATKTRRLGVYTSEAVISGDSSPTLPTLQRSTTWPISVHGQLLASRSFFLLMRRRSHRSLNMPPVSPRRLAPTTSKTSSVTPPPPSNS